MESASSFISFLLKIARGVLVLSAIAVAGCLAAGAQGLTQAPPPTTPDAPPSPGDNIRYGYVIHQSIDLGGHIAEDSGSSAMYDTLVNIQSGPRILDSTFQMFAVNPAHAILFDRLTSSSFGYGGDPYNVTRLNFSKGRIYDFSSSFRRDRQYFDYDLLANPLIPPASTPFVPALNSPHLFNTVRRMTDVGVTVLPLSKVSFRAGYFQNINQGPTFSSVHVGTDALLSENWRVSTDVWNGGIDWKPLAGTSLSFDEYITHYKGNTNWQLTGLNYTLSNGTPVSGGINLSSVWNTPCSQPFQPDGTFNPTCNAYLSYSRYAPTRALFPSERLHFQSSSIPNVTMNGRVMYMGTTSNLTNYNENFNGLVSKSQTRATIVTGSAAARRINVNADYGVTWQITPTISLNDIFDFWYFRQPANNTFTETDFAGTSMLNPPGAATTTTTPDYQALNQKTKANTFYAVWNALPQAQLSLGYRYRGRTITDAGGDFIPINENGGIVGIVFRPSSQLRVNYNMELMYADNSFTRISPRQVQHYFLSTSYRPHPWLTFAGTLNIYERRDNVQTVNYLAHNRNYSFGATINPNEKWGMDVNYSYTDIYSTVAECYPSSAPVGGDQSQPSPPVCQQAGLPFQGNGYYDQPTQYGYIAFMLNPMKKLHASAGYRMSDVNGTAPGINVRQVPGSLQSQYQTPFGRLAWDFDSNWSWHGEYNYYSYGEGTPIGPTLPRSFRGNVYTLSVRYAF